MLTGAQKCSLPFPHLGFIGSREVVESRNNILLASKPIPMDPLPPARLYPLKVSKSPKSVLPAESHVFKHSNMCVHLQITTDPENKPAAQRRGDFYKTEKQEVWIIESQR